MTEQEPCIRLVQGKGERRFFIKVCNVEAYSPISRATSSRYIIQLKHRELGFSFSNSLVSRYHLCYKGYNHLQILFQIAILMSQGH